MDRATSPDHRYCTLRVAESEVFVGDREPMRFIHECEGQIEVFGADDSDVIPVGSFSVLIVDIESAINEGVHPFDVMDSRSETAHYYDKLYRRAWSGADFREPVINAVFGQASPWHPNLLILDRLAVFPEHRGHGVGLLALRGLIERFRIGVGLIVMKPFPLQFESVPTSPDDIAARRRLGLDDFRMGYRSAVAKLRSYYASLGFRHIPRTSLMGLAPENYVPARD